MTAYPYGAEMQTGQMKDLRVVDGLAYERRSGPNGVGFYNDDHKYFLTVAEAAARSSVTQQVVSPVVKPAEPEDTAGVVGIVAAVVAFLVVGSILSFGIGPFSLLPAVWAAKFAYRAGNATATGVIG